MSGSRQCLRSALAKIEHRLVPHLSSVGVVGQALDMFRDSVTVESFDHLDDASVEKTSTFLEDAPVSHLVSQGVLEDVLRIGKERRLIQELCRLQMREMAMQVCLRLVDDGLKQPKGYVLPDDRGCLEERLLR